jgi:hypothetical protein
MLGWVRGGGEIGKKQVQVGGQVALAQCGRTDAGQSHEQYRARDFGGVFPRVNRFARRAWVE